MSDLATTVAASASAAAALAAWFQAIRGMRAAQSARADAHAAVSRSLDALMPDYQVRLVEATDGIDVCIRNMSVGRISARLLQEGWQLDTVLGPLGGDEYGPSSLHIFPVPAVREGNGGLILEIGPLSHQVRDRMNLDKAMKETHLLGTEYVIEPHSECVERIYSSS